MSAPESAFLERRPRLAVGLLILGVFLLHLAGTWALPLCDRDEPRFAEASREMLQRGDWIVPWFNNEPRYDKPPLVYWLQITAYRCLGQNEFAARLPSVISAALTALVIFGFGRRLAGAFTGFWAAVIFSTCLQTVAHSKSAVADMLMILWFTLAAWSAWELTRPEVRRRNAWWAVLCFSLGLAFLAKGPIGLLPVLFPFLAAGLTRLPQPRAQMRPVWLTLIVLGIVGAWGIPALLQTGGDFWRVGMGKHVFQRSVGVLDGHGAGSFLTYFASLPFYFGTVFISFFPWSIWLIWLGRRLWQRRRTLNRDEAFLLLGTLLVFGIFTLVRTKLPHYTLPAFPLLALLLAREWQRTAHPMRRPVATALGMAAFALVLALLVVPRVAVWFPSRELARRCASWLRPETELASHGYNEASLCWYFRGHIRGFHEMLSPDELVAFMARPGSRVAVLPTPKVATIFPEIPAGWHRVDVVGFNTAKGRRIALTALVKDASP